jgi:hypothetical protein
MKFIRHVLAVTAVVGLVVALGFAWSHSSAASLVADGRRDRRAVPAAVARTGSNAADLSRQFDQRGAHGLSLSNISDLVQTLVVLALILGAVVAIDLAHRRRNPRVPTAAFKSKSG